MRRIAFGITTLALLLAPAAHASTFTPEAEADYAYAVSYWDLGEPSGCVTLAKEMFPRDPESTVVGEATQPTPNEQTPCILRVAEGLSECLTLGVMVHEVGHLLGMAHAENPKSPMHPGNAVLWCIKEQDEERIGELQHYVDLRQHVCPRFSTRLRRGRCWTQRRRYLAQLREVEAEMLSLIIK